ncbi:MAG: hypothetical protein ABI847_07040 [Anaerolineales bacterium]
MLATQDVHTAIAEAARQFPRERAAAVAQRDEIFRRGVAPRPALDGRYRGALLTTSVNPFINGLARAVTRRWLTWKGKVFDAATQSGDNMFTNDGLWASKLVFPGYQGTHPDGPGRSRALQFRTYLGPGKDDPGLEVLKLDYNLETNPGFIVRDVLDELVQVDSGYYLGKAHLFWRNRWRCAAYFTLQPM